MEPGELAGSLVEALPNRVEVQTKPGNRESARCPELVSVLARCSGDLGTPDEFLPIAEA